MGIRAVATPLEGLLDYRSRYCKRRLIRSRMLALVQTPKREDTVTTLTALLITLFTTRSCGISTLHRSGAEDRRYIGR